MTYIIFDTEQDAFVGKPMDLDAALQVAKSRARVTGSVQGLFKLIQTHVIKPPPNSQVTVEELVEAPKDPL